MRHILLLNPPGEELVLRDNYCTCSSKAGYSWPPIDLLVLSGMLSGRFTVSVMDAMAERLRPEDCLRRIVQMGPDAVVSLTGTASWSGDLRFLSRLKRKVPAAAVFVSGGPLLVDGRRVLESHPFIDGAVLNYVDNGLADHLENGTGGRNLLWRSAGGVEGSEQITCPDEFSYPLPLHGLFPLAGYRTLIAARKPLTCVVGSFGCPFRCGFCVFGLLPYRTRSVDNLLEELAHVRRMGIREVMFSDPTFTINKDRVLRICAGMNKLSLGLSWTCTAHAATVSRELLSAMKAAGCHLVEIGVESGSDDILRAYSKKTATGQTREAVGLCASCGIDVLGYFIIGLPGETKTHILDTIRFAQELDCALASFSVATPDRGTRLWAESIRNGWADAGREEYDSSRSAVISSGLVSPEEIIRLKDRAFREFYLRPGKILKLLALSLRGNARDWVFFCAGLLRRVLLARPSSADEPE